MNQEIKDRWVNALESGRYRQGVGMLHTNHGGVEQFCCLGVLSDLAHLDGVVAREYVPTEFGIDSFYRYDSCSVMSLSRTVVKWAELDRSNPDVEYLDRLRPLAFLNDVLAVPFAEIAVAIKESL